MAIIAISRGSYSMGKAVAEKVAEHLGFECLSRDVLLEAGEQFNIPEIQLQKAITDAPSILERVTHGKQRYVAYFQSALLRHLCKEDVVYHGLAGHARLRHVPHILRVRIVADMALRISIVTKRENLGPHEAAAWITKLDNERRKWTKSLHHVDPWDPTLYDLLLNIPRFSIDDAVEMICSAVKLEQFQATAESRQQLEDLALACEIKAELVNKHPDAMVTSTYGNVLVYCAAGDRHANKVKEAVREVCSKTSKVNSFEVHAGTSPPPNAA